MVLHYPALTTDEFAEACSQLEHRCRGKLQDNSWVAVHWTGDELEIVQKREVIQKPSSYQIEESMDSEIDEDDPELLHRAANQTTSEIVVKFSIVLSPTYQVPVLWFSTSSTSSLGINSLDQVYDSLVSPPSRNVLQQTGVLGGISIDHHPKSDMPAFFVHPCRTQEALATVQPTAETTPLDYLMLWFGVIGCAVGLTIPSAVMADR